MGADYIVHLSCAPKLTFGDGDALKGTQAMMDMVKARNRARVLAEASPGKDPSTLKVVVVRRTPEGESQQEISYSDLMAQAAPLDQLARSCEGCPANVLGTPYGCYGAVSYPVTAAAEKWMVNRLQPADSPGGFMLLSAIRDFNYDGAPVQRMRASGMFELKAPAEKVVQKKLFGSTKVNADQIFQAFFSVGGALGAAHCALLLTFIGALEINGRIPASKSVDAPLLNAAMQAKTANERRELAKLYLGPESPELVQIHNLVKATFAAWVLDVDLLMDA